MMKYILHKVEVYYMIHFFSCVMMEPIYTQDELALVIPYGPDPFPLNRPIAAYGSPDKSRRCIVCYNRHGTSRFHRHHSSFFYHSTLKLRKIYTVDCPSCKCTHNLGKREDRAVVLMTSSTLHNVFMNPDVRMRFHMDIKSICVGTTLDLWQAWSRTYELDSGPTDIIISLGLNDRC